jgi:gluconate 2-dehydrogenase alpha chain
MTTRIAILGGGASGLIAARTIAAAKDVELVVFERGERNPAGRIGFPSTTPKDSLLWEVMQFLQPRVSNEPRFFRYGHSESAQDEISGWGWPGVGLGGGTLRWGGACWRYRREDFDLPSLYRGVVSNEKDLEPWPSEASAELFHSTYYSRAEQLLGVAGEGSATDPVRAPTYARPPLWETGVMRRFKEAAADWIGTGDSVCTVPLAIDTVARCTRDTQCAPCMSYLCPFGDDVRFNSGSEAFISSIVSDRSTIRTGCVVRRVLHSNGKVTGIEFIDVSAPDVPRVEQFDVVVCACAALESARLFLMSDVPDPEHLTGHFLTFHVHPTTLGFFEQPVNAHHKYHQAATTHLTRLTRNGATVMGGLVDLNATYTPHAFFGQSSLIADAFGTKEWGPTFFRAASQAFSRHVSLGGTAEDLPDYRNRVELVPDRLDVFGRPSIRIVYEDHLLNHFVFDQVISAQQGILRRMGATKTASTKLHTGLDHHQHGTLRMSGQVRRGVLTPYCESWHVKNLFAVDGSSFPNSGCVNPTLTIAANALRVADYIVARS